MSESKIIAVDGLGPAKAGAPAHRPSGWRILPATLVALAGGAGLINILAPFAASHAGHVASRLVTAAAYQQGSIRLASLEAANLLAPGNRAAASVTALDQARDGQAGAALATLAGIRDRSGGEATYQTAVIAANLQASRTDVALAAAQKVVAIPEAGDDALVMAALAYGVGDRPQDANALVARTGSPEARRSVVMSATNKLTLADALQASGLYISSSKILNPLPVSVPRNLLLAHAIEAGGAGDYADRAIKLYHEVTRLDVTNRQAHAGLLRLLERTGRPDEARQEQALLDRLDSQKP